MSPQWCHFVHISNFLWISLTPRNVWHRLKRVLNPNMNPAHLPPTTLESRVSCPPWVRCPLSSVCLNLHLPTPLSEQSKKKTKTRWQKMTGCLESVTQRVLRRDDCQWKSTGRFRPALERWGLWMNVYKASSALAITKHESCLSDWNGNCSDSLFSAICPLHLTFTNFPFPLFFDVVFAMKVMIKTSVKQSSNVLRVF